MVLLIAGSALAAGAWSVNPAGASPQDHVPIRDCVDIGHPYPNLERGDGYGGPVTNAVKRAQCLLNWSVTYQPRLAVDGEFGERTEARTTAFQRCMRDRYGHNIYVDGEIGPQTWPLLEYWAAAPTYAC